MLYKTFFLRTIVNILLINSKIVITFNLTTDSVDNHEHFFNNWQVDESHETINTNLDNHQTPTNRPELLNFAENGSKSNNFQKTSFSSLFTTSYETSTLKDYTCEDSLTIDNVQIIPKSESLYVSWNTSNPSCISKYEVDWFIEDQSSKIFRALTNETNITILSLQFCTVYIVSIIPITLQDAEGPIKTVKAETTLEGKKIAVEQFDVVSYTQQSIHLTWIVKPKCSMVKNYLLSWISSNQTQSKVLDPGVEDYIIADLKPCTHFELMLSVNDIDNKVLATRTIVAHTENDAPGYVKMWVESEKESLIIFWNKPIEGATCVLNYLITVYQSDGIKSDSFCSETDESCKIIDTQNMPIIKAEDSNSFSCTIDSLEPCTKYTISIQARGTENTLGPSTTKIVELLEEDLPAVENVTIIPYPDKLLMLWEPPSNAHQCVAKYNVKCSHDNYNFEATTINTQIWIEFLEPCTNYDILITPISKNNVFGEPYLTSEETLEEDPSQVTDLIGWSNETGTIELQWSKPLIASACVTQYRIYNASYTILTVEPNIVFYGLEPCKTYNYSVEPLTKNATQGPPNIVIVSVKAEDPSEPILITKQRETNYFVLRFRVADDNNDCPLLEARTVCNISLLRNDSLKDWMILSGEGIYLFGSYSPITFDVSVEKLSPYTRYICRTVLINVAGESKENIQVMDTLEDVPSPPTLSDYYESGTNWISLYWTNPQMVPGNPIKNNIQIKEIERLYFIPANCSYMLFTNNTMVDFLITTWNITNLTAFSLYSFKVRSSTAVGWSDYSNVLTARTLPYVSNTVANLDYQWDNFDLLNYNVKASISWTRPCFTNGIFRNYKVVTIGTRQNYPDDFREDVILNDTMTTYSVTKIRPEYHYEIYVFVNVANVTTHPLQSMVNFNGPAGIPPPSSLVLSTPTPVSSKPTNEVLIMIPNDLFSYAMGDIIYYAVMVAEKGFEGTPKYGVLNSSVEWPNVSGWYEVQKFTSIYPYQTTKERWCPFSDNCNSNTYTMWVSYTIGNESCTSSTTSRYCNGLLRAGTNYCVWIRGFTSHGYRDSKSTSFTTKTLLPMSLILGLVIAILIMGGLFMLFIYLRKRGNSIHWSKKLCSWNDQNAHPPAVSVQNFPNHYKSLTQNPNQLQNEYLLLATASDSIAMPTYTAELPHNRIKNRYPDIKPYDATRVKLRVVPDEFSDYINASYIKGFHDDIEYIATQGPKEGTVSDFWQMVYENEVRQIVMVTQLREKGKLKCYKYYPEDSEPLHCDNGIILVCQSHEVRRSFIIRYIKLKYNKNEKYIKHLQFLEWPDFGVPETTDAMLQLCREIRLTQAQNYGTVVVHCSAGVGRTGTVIAVDILAQIVNARKKLDVFGTVLNLRKQRARMVQNDGQYKYIYQCIMDEILYPRVFQAKQEPIYENVPAIRRISLESEM